MVGMFAVLMKDIKAYGAIIRRLYKKGAQCSATSVVRLNHDDAGRSLVRLPGFCINGAERTERKFDRGSLVHITNQDTGETAVRYVAGAGRKYKDMPKNGIAMDYDTQRQLGLVSHSEDEPVQLSIRNASPWEEANFHCYEHHDANARLAQLNGYRGLFLGVVGLVLGLMSLL